KGVWEWWVGKRGGEGGVRDGEWGDGGEWLGEWMGLEGEGWVMVGEGDEEVEVVVCGVDLEGEVWWGWEEGRKGEKGGRGVEEGYGVE
ncbi:hypothetical protein, partial [Kocuria rhizophila]|uniref:hypothetical protein n=1 Tax=Kocuria rhizophila TaxID=72000 RepID=UPI001C92D802